MVKSLSQTLQVTDNILILTNHQFASKNVVVHFILISLYFSITSNLMAFSLQLLAFWHMINTMIASISDKNTKINETKRYQSKAFGQLTLGKFPFRDPRRNMMVRIVVIPKAILFPMSSTSIQNTIQLSITTKMSGKYTWMRKQPIRLSKQKLAVTVENVSAER